MGYKAVGTQRWKYIHYLELDGVDELYDLKAGPYEMKNLIRQPDAKKDAQGDEEGIGTVAKRNEGQKSPAAWCSETTRPSNSDGLQLKTAATFPRLNQRCTGLFAAPVLGALQDLFTAKEPTTLIALGHQHLLRKETDSCLK
jgi:hypothetical protein